MKILILVYDHRHGTDIFLVKITGDVPPVTNELLAKFGVDEPELEREDEDAYWLDPGPEQTWPII